MAVGRYVVIDVDHDNKTILGGPLLWDPDGPPYNPGDGRELMPEAEALAEGWQYPPPEV